MKYSIYKILEKRKFRDFSIILMSHSLRNPYFMGCRKKNGVQQETPVTLYTIQGLNYYNWACTREKGFPSCTSKISSTSSNFL